MRVSPPRNWLRSQHGGAPAPSQARFVTLRTVGVFGVVGAVLVAVAIAIVMDAHGSGDPGDAFKGFSARVKEMGSSATRSTVAGTDAGFARVDDVEAGVGAQKGDG